MSTSDTTRSGHENTPPPNALKTGLYLSVALGVVAVPFGIWLASMGLRGSLIDGSQAENLRAGLVGVCIAAAPVLTGLAFWLRMRSRRGSESPGTGG